jgi:3,5-epimerase/4-reductase
MKWLIYGGNGWIGTYVISVINRDNEQVVVLGTARLNNMKDVEKELLDVKPDRVISIIGRISGEGINNIDYLEQKGKLVENVRDNLFANYNIAHATNKQGIHLTYFGTGCIFNGYKDGVGYTEEDEPDFFGSSYSVVKGFTDQMMKNYDNVLNARIRMPIMDDSNPKNFIVKLLNYPKICSIPNSMTVLPELVPILIDMAIKKVSGTYNIVNPGVITHNEILDMVKKYVKPNLVWENFTIDEQREVLKSDRSNNQLCTDKLESLYKVKNIKESVEEIIRNLRL